MTDQSAGASLARYGIVLGALASLGPLSIDMYLPALPLITRDLNGSEGAIQLSVMIFFVGLVLGQLFYGPISDRVGRRPPIYVGLTLFILASIGCATAETVDALLVWRFVQGAGGCVGFVIGMAIVRDLYTGAAAARIFSAIMLVLGVAPILAPLAGSLIIEVTSWRVIFLAIAAYGALCVALALWLLPETRNAEARAATRLGQTLHNYWRLLGDGRFIVTSLVPGFAQGGFYAYLAGSAFVFITIHGLSPLGYSLVFALNSVGLITASQFNPWLIRLFGMHRLIGFVVATFAAAGILLLASVVAGVDSAWVIAALTFVCVTCLGIIFPTSNILALEPMGRMAGTASAVMGALQFSAGVTGAAAVSALADGTTLPMVLVIAVWGTVSFALSRIVLASHRRAEATT